MFLLTFQKEYRTIPLLWHMLSDEINFLIIKIFILQQDSSEAPTTDKLLEEENLRRWYWEKKIQVLFFLAASQNENLIRNELSYFKSHRFSFNPLICFLYFFFINIYFVLLVFNVFYKEIISNFFNVFFFLSFFENKYYLYSFLVIFETEGQRKLKNLRWM